MVLGSCHNRSIPVVRANARRTAFLGVRAQDGVCFALHCSLAQHAGRPGGSSSEMPVAAQMHADMLPSTPAHNAVARGGADLRVRGCRQSRAKVLQQTKPQSSNGNRQRPHLRVTAGTDLGFFAMCCPFAVLYCLPAPATVLSVSVPVYASVFVPASVPTHHWLSASVAISVCVLGGGCGRA